MAAQDLTVEQKALRHNFQRVRHIIAELDFVAAELGLEGASTEESVEEPVQGLIEAILDSTARLDPALEACTPYGGSG